MRDIINKIIVIMLFMCAVITLLCCLNAYENNLITGYQFIFGCCFAISMCLSALLIFALFSVVDDNKSLKEEYEKLQEENTKLFDRVYPKYNNPEEHICYKPTIHTPVSVEDYNINLEENDV